MQNNDLRNHHVKIDHASSHFNYVIFTISCRQTRDGHLKDGADIATLKPYTLNLVEGMVILTAYNSHTMKTHKEHNAHIYLLDAYNFL